MARVPDARAEQAKKLYLQGMKLIDIAEDLGVPEGTVRSWKNRYHWEGNTNATLQKPKRNVAKKRGGQPGNKNAVGHGWTGQPGNKNALKTGEFETLFFDTLNCEEQQLLNMVQSDKKQLLLQEIKLLTIREYRMMKRIESLKVVEDISGDKDEEDDLLKVPTGMSVVKYASGIEKGKITQLKEYEGILGQIQSIEDALTRVQARRQRAIEALHKFGYDDAHLELEIMKFEFEMLKQDGQEQDLEDDGFNEAMNAAAQEVWGDADV